MALLVVYLNLTPSWASPSAVFTARDQPGSHSMLTATQEAAGVGVHDPHSTGREARVRVGRDWSQVTGLGVLYSVQCLH